MLSSLFIFHHQSISPPIFFCFFPIFSHLFHQPINTPSLVSKMATKRIREDPDKNTDKPEGKRIRSLPSFTMVIRQAVVENSRQNLCLALEPVIRKVVQEEVERVFVRCACLFQRSPQMLIEEAKPSSGLQLIFKKPPSLPIFTENKIEDEDGSPLEILLIDTATGRKPRTSFPSSIKVELLVLDGDFACDNSDNWSSTDFNRHIVKERVGRKPLLIGDTMVTLKDGTASIDELKFTDNSSWIRCRNFRIGVRVLSESQQDLNVREAVTNRFVVKDHRGEAYKKHYPPALGDEVWRLEKIGKEGVFHKKLMDKNINTVQDFLKLSVIDSAQLRNILGMSDRNWDSTINHARTCPLGEKLYIHRTPHCAILLSPICEVMNIEIDGVSWTFQDLSIPWRDTVQELVSQAYNCWNMLEEISLPLQDQVVIEPAYQIERVLEVQMGLDNWPMQNIY